MSVDADIPVALSLVFICGGLVALAWSADMFIAAAAALARRYGLSPFVVGMVVIGFGTSAPELAVSAISGVGGHSNLSLGNAYGSCIFNITAILGVSALIRPVAVKPAAIRIAVPVLIAITALSYWMVKDASFSRADGFVLLALFAAIMPAYCWYDQRFSGATRPGARRGGNAGGGPVLWQWVRLFLGLVLLVGSSHLLVWGCVDFARDVMHVGELMIGLTVVAAGTSLPELASAVASARRGESEFVIGNIIGSNLFNMLAVVGIAGAISPFENFSPYIATRDIPAMFAATLSIAVFGMRWRKAGEAGSISRKCGIAWLFSFAVYMTVMICQEMR